MKLNNNYIIDLMRANLNEYEGKKFWIEHGCKEYNVWDRSIQYYDTTTQFHAGVRDRILHLIFRGSEDTEIENADWQKNFQFELITQKVETKIKVHKGFLAGYNIVADSVIGLCDGVERVVVSGHSYGAAVATLAAENIAFKYPHADVSLCALSSPRVGNDEFSKVIEKRIADRYRIWYGDDTVTRVPPWICGYRHIPAIETHLWKNYFLPWNWITAVTSWPGDHYPDLLLTEYEKWAIKQK